MIGELELGVVRPVRQLLLNQQGQLNLQLCRTRTQLGQGLIGELELVVARQVRQLLLNHLNPLQRPPQLPPCQSVPLPHKLKTPERQPRLSNHHRPSPLPFLLNLKSNLLSLSILLQSQSIQFQFQSLSFPMKPNKKMCHFSQFYHHRLRRPQHRLSL